MKHFPAIIIGAGPAGLSVAYELKKQGISNIVFEASDCIGRTFAAMTEQTTYGPWLNNLLRGTTWDPWGAWYRILARTTRKEYAAYLQEYAQRLDLNVVKECPVLKVESAAPTFRVETAKGTYTSGSVVNCAGYFSTPLIPDYQGSAQSDIPSMHTSEYRSPASVGRLIGDRGRVLIVGKRLSAGETLAELLAAGFEVAISHRSPIEYWPDVWKETLMSPFILCDEYIRRKLDLGRPYHLKPRMRSQEHGQSIHSGVTPTYPDIKEFKKEHVVFEDGREECFDLVIYGTGYGGNFAHLDGLRLPSLQKGSAPAVRQLESTELSNLFFVGLIEGSSFRSEFLRGIREDAQRVGEVVASRVRFAPIAATAPQSI